MGTDVAAGAHSPATAGTPDIAHWGQPSPLRAHTGQQICAQSLTTLAHTAPGNPAITNRSHHMVTHYTAEQNHVATLSKLIDIF